MCVCVVHTHLLSYSNVLKSHRFSVFKLTCEAKGKKTQLLGGVHGSETYVLKLLKRGYNECRFSTTNNRVSKELRHDILSHFFDRNWSKLLLKC